VGAQKNIEALAFVQIDEKWNGGLGSLLALPLFQPLISLKHSEEETSQKTCEDNIRSFPSHPFYCLFWCVFVNNVLTN
jgi:hypothetical protein